VTGAGGMPWQNCHGYLFLLLILLIVALIVAAQLLWQYFLPSRLVAALDHKRHLPPNTNTLPLKNLYIASLTYLREFTTGCILETLIIYVSMSVSKVDVLFYQASYSAEHVKAQAGDYHPEMHGSGSIN
jgi:hypothetical protein